MSTMRSSPRRSPRGSASPSAADPTAAVPSPTEMSFINEDAVLQSDHTLAMVHQLDVEKNLNRYGEYVRGTSLWRTKEHHLLDKGDPAYRFGGIVLTVMVIEPGRPIGPTMSLSVCLSSSCTVCFQEEGTRGTQTRGLPFIHALNARANRSNSDLSFKIDRNTLVPETLTDMKLEVTVCEKKLIYFEIPYGGFEDGDPIVVGVVTAVCVPANCSECRPPLDGPSHSPGTTGAPSDRVGSTNNTEADEDDPMPDIGDAPPSSDGDSDTMGDDLARPLPTIDAQGNMTWEMDGILDSQFTSGSIDEDDDGFRYLVSWDGYSASERTWEPIRNVQEWPQFIWEYHERWPDSPWPTAASSRQHGLVAPAEPRRRA